MNLSCRLSLLVFLLLVFHVEGIIGGPWRQPKPVKIVKDNPESYAAQQRIRINVLTPINVILIIEFKREVKDGEGSREGTWTAFQVCI